MGRFIVFVAGYPKPLPVELPASSIDDVEELIGGRRFIRGDMIDVPNGDGFCSTRKGLIPAARIQMILEDE